MNVVGDKSNVFILDVENIHLVRRIRGWRIINAAHPPHALGKFLRQGATATKQFQRTELAAAHGMGPYGTIGSPAEELKKVHVFKRAVLVVGNFPHLNLVASLESSVSWGACWRRCWRIAMNILGGN